MNRLSRREFVRLSAAGAVASPFALNPVFAAKSEFIKASQLVVWRFSAHWRLRTPDPFAQGIIDALGWAKHPTRSTPAYVRVPPVALETLVADVKARLGARGGMRIVGHPRARLQTIAVLPGTVPIEHAGNGAVDPELCP